jgi:nitric oxide reductase subunit B
MEYGSVFGHGAYLGPDYTADYLRRSTTAVLSSFGTNDSDRARELTVQVFKTNLFDAATDMLRLTGPQASAHRELVAYYSKFFAEPSTRFGLRPGAITDPKQASDLTAFFAWSAWASAALRPGRLFVYEQLASRATGSQQRHGR